MRKMRLAGSLAAACLAMLALGMPAAAADSPSGQDKAFMAKNAQTDLAEIAIGQIATSRSSNSQTLALANKTVSDHQAALTKLKSVAQSADVTLPTAPNPQQQADAQKLKTVAADAFDLTYAQVQVAGHNLSIGDTKTELSSGSDLTVTDYANGYLPVAQMHLSMAEDLLSSLGGNPGSVPAGTGGLAAATSSSTVLEQVGIGVVGVALLGGAVVMIRRRRVTS